MKADTIIIHRNTNDPFARVPKDVLNDKTLSWKSKGVLAYLLGKPQDWQIQVQDIVNHGPDGEGAVRSAEKELRDAGYAKLESIREKGKMVKWVLKVSDMPIFIESEPDGGFPHLEKPHLENRPLTKNELTKNEETKKEPPTPFESRKLSSPVALSVTIPLLLQTSEFKAVWPEWVDDRKKRRYPMTERAMEMQLKDLEKMGPKEAVKAIRNAIECGYRKPYRVKEYNNGALSHKGPAAISTVDYSRGA